MSRNLVLAAAVGYNFEQISLFLKSLRKYYSDEICIIIDGKDKLSIEMSSFNKRIKQKKTDQNLINTVN